MAKNYIQVENKFYYTSNVWTELNKKQWLFFSVNTAYIILIVSDFNTAISKRKWQKKERKNNRKNNFKI